LLAQDSDALIFPAQLLDVAIDSSDETLKRVAERFVANLIRRFPLDLGRQVAALVVRQLASGGCTLPRIAQQLGLAKRTLQRRLQAQGIHFEDIVDGVRQQRAREYLLQTAIPMTQVCSLLGYTEQSTFNRACRRWFGSSPLAFRQESSSRLLSAASSGMSTIPRS
jgi:AraC-like DNA-binding protein